MKERAPPSDRAAALRWAASFLAALVFGSGALAQGAASGAAPRAAPVAVTTAPGAAWNSLTPAQQTALAPLKRDWATIDRMRREKWLEIAARFPRMPADERERVQARMAEWARMSPNERSRARFQYQEARQLSPADRQARWEEYKSLPEEKRKALADRSRPPVAAASRPTSKTGDPRSRELSPAASEKRNMVGNAAMQAPRPKVVTPTLVQAKPGATTNLISKPASPPRHEQVGMPKIVATPGFVDRSTLLPQRGPQGAAAVAPSAGSAPARRP